MATTPTSPRVKSLSAKEIEEIRASFEEFDLDNNGHISAGELGSAMSALGEKVPGYKVREMIQSVDKDQNGTINFNEFLTLFTDIHKSKVAGTFLTALSKKEGISSLKGTSDTSAEGTTHSVAEAEKVAFANYINKVLYHDDDVKDYLPIDASNQDIYSKVSDGILLCKMINVSMKGTVDERAINLGKKKMNLYNKRENLTLALNSARSIGCSLVNIGAEDLDKGTPHLVLGLLWQIIRVGLFAKIDLQNVPGLMRLLREGEEIKDLLALSPEELLIRWVNYHLEQAGNSRRIGNFGEDIKDSEVYCVLLEQIAPHDIRMEPVNFSAPPLKKAEDTLANADKLKCRSFVTPQDIVNGNHKLNMAFVANLFNSHPGLEPPEERFEEEIEETREEKTFRNWMNSLGVNPYVHHLYSDLTNGLVLLELIKIIKKDTPNFVNPDKVNTKFSKMGGNIRKLENCSYVVELCHQMRFSMVGIGGRDINDGNVTLTLAVVWQLMRAYTVGLLATLFKDRAATDKDVMEAVNNQLEQAGKETRITSFKDPAIRESKVILELVDAIRPRSVNWTNYNDTARTDEELLANAKYALSMSRKIGARVYALPEDIVEVNPKMVMTIFACLIALTKANEKDPEA